MSTSRQTFPRALSVLAGFSAIFLAGCEVPVLHSISPDTAPQGQGVQLTLSGSAFTSDSRLLIDGSLDGVGTDITIGQLGFSTAETLTASLQIGANVFPGAHSIAVGNSSGISDPQYLYVGCLGCPPPPRLHKLSENHPFSSLIFRGSTDTIRILGSNLRDSNGPATILISGIGLTFDPDFVVADEGSGDLQTIDLPVTVALDARTGYRELRVQTTGGMSNPLLLEVAAPQSRAPGIVEVTLAGGECLKHGDNFLTVRGYNFVPGTVIHVQYLGGGLSRTVTDPNPTIYNSRELAATITVPEALSSLSFSTRAESINGGSFIYPIVCQSQPPTPTPTATATATPTPSPGGPVITSITPARVGTGVEFLIKCEGSGFGTSRQVITDPPLQTTTYGVASAAADPDQVVVAKIVAWAAGSVQIRVKNLVQQTTSDEVILFVDDPAPGVPVAQGATGNGVHRGGGFDLTVYGSNLEGLTDHSWHGIPGLSYSNTTSSANTATVHIEADGNAPLTADEATNLRITTPAGQSPPFLFRVFQ